jgi:hypothetical protein
MRGEGHPSGPLQVRGVPNAAYGHDRNNLRGQPHPPEQVVACLPSTVRQQKGHERAPASPDAQGYVQERMFHGSSDSLHDDPRTIAIEADAPDVTGVHATVAL